MKSKVVRKPLGAHNSAPPQYNTMEDYHRAAQQIEKRVRLMVGHMHQQDARQVRSEKVEEDNRMVKPSIRECAGEFARQALFAPTAPSTIARSLLPFGTEAAAVAIYQMMNDSSAPPAAGAAMPLGFGMYAPQANPLIAQAQQAQQLQWARALEAQDAIMLSDFQMQTLQDAQRGIGTGTHLDQGSEGKSLIPLTELPEEYVVPANADESFPPPMMSCSICLDIYDSRADGDFPCNMWVHVPCCHQPFHKDCILHHLRGDKRCPLCRQGIR